MSKRRKGGRPVGPFPQSPMPTAAGSPSPSIANDRSDNRRSDPNSAACGVPAGSAMQSWWESISRARSRILSLASLLSSPDLASLADSEQPARSLLECPAAYAALSAALSAAPAGSGEDPLCQWLYDTFQSPDPELRLFVLSLLPLLAGVYLSRVVSSAADPPSLAGFEAVLLALYAGEVKSRAGKPVLVSIPDLSLPSLYHTPRQSSSATTTAPPPRPSVGVLSPPLEPQSSVKSVERACIIAAALDSYYKVIPSMPSRSKIDFCEFVAAWAGQDCACRFELDDDEPAHPSSLCSSCPPPPPSSSSSSSSIPQFRITSEDHGGSARQRSQMRTLTIREGLNDEHRDGNEEEGGGRRKGSRVPLPWELLQPVLRILGHCLLAPLNPQEVKDSASMAVRCVYARASHDLLPPAILASRSLIQLDKSSRKVAKPPETPAMANYSSKLDAPAKLKKPKVFLFTNR